MPVWGHEPENRVHEWDGREQPKKRQSRTLEWVVDRRRLPPMGDRYPKILAEAHRRHERGVHRSNAAATT